MIGSYISDDFQFYFEPQEIKTLEETRNTLIGNFTCYNNSGEGLVRMKLSVEVDDPTVQKSSRIKMDFRKKKCTLSFSEQDFKEWLSHPDPFTLKQGPNWRFASSNVYIKTEKADGAEIFRRTIYGFLFRAGF